MIARYGFMGRSRVIGSVEDPVGIAGKYLSPTILARLQAAGKKPGKTSSVLALHAWWTSPVWYNLIFGVSSMAVGSETETAGNESVNDGSSAPNLIFNLTFDRGGHQSSQGARSLDKWWIEGDLAFLDSPGEWFHDATTEKLHLLRSRSRSMSSI